MIRRPPRSTLSSSSAASDVYKRQNLNTFKNAFPQCPRTLGHPTGMSQHAGHVPAVATKVLALPRVLVPDFVRLHRTVTRFSHSLRSVSYTHLTLPTKRIV
eukprot:TRINITY_DN2816_c0_g2_i5.p1 TRINITY_DN2816_c0_g2~~TRINITY_DN2816_c0_g2_i5.p1  ORF type:complete len:101 (-),score=2.31 TRINITY_DN2816_c0_g2_i5:120-422(-)